MTETEFIKWVAEIPTSKELGRDRLYPNEVLDKVVYRARRLAEVLRKPPDRITIKVGSTMGKTGSMDARNVAHDRT